MRRVRDYSVLGAIVLLSSAASLSASSSALPLDTPVCRLACELRCALGFGPDHLAVMDVDSATSMAICDASFEYCLEHLQEVQDVLEPLRTARAAELDTYENGGDSADATAGTAAAVAANDALEQALATVGGECSDLTEGLRSFLSQSQQAIHARIAAAPLLDPACALVELTAEQRESLRQASVARDVVLRHHRLRKNSVVVRQALERYAADLAGALTPQQGDDQQAGEAAVAENSPSLLELETALCGEWVEIE